MADIRKEQERDELHRAIWAIADELRGAVDGWDFKNYVLGTMFYRYISENLCNYINAGEIEAGNADFDYAKLSDEEAEEAREGLVQEKGFFILLFVSFGQISLAYGAGTGESAIYRGMVQEVSLRQVRREENGGFREVLKCRDEGALTDYLASLPLSEIVDGGDDFYGKEGEEIVLLYDAPEDILSVMLWDDYIRVMPFWENRAYYYHVSGGLDWETLNQLLGEPA